MAESTLNTTVLGRATNGSFWICEESIKYQRSRGIFFGDNPFNFTLPVLFIQTSLVSIFTSILQFLLKPLGETRFLPQILAGMILGPSVIGQSGLIKKWLFPPKTFYISETIAFFGSMMYLFLIAIKVDLGSFMRTGKKAWAIGIFSFLIPLLITTFSAFILRKILTQNEQTIHKSLISLAFLFSTGSFHTTTVHLADLKLLNSEMGRLATSASMVGGSISLFCVTTLATNKQASMHKDYYSNINWTRLCFVAMIATIMCVLRPIMFWMIRQTPEGKPIKESYIISVFLMLLGLSLFSESIGEHFMVGPIIFGIAVPDGPPLGSALSERLDTMVSTVFLPFYYLYSGSRFNVFLTNKRCFFVVQLIAIIAFFGKVLGAVLPTLYWSMPTTDVLSLGLLLSAQGMDHLLYFQTAEYLTIIDDESYGSAIIALLWLTGLTTPIVKFLYDPSKRYLSLNRRRTIEQAPKDIELRLMACIHTQENTPSIINLLEMSNPSLENPICFYVLHLIQLKGRIEPLFIDHQSTKKTNNVSHSNSSYSQHIINAFRCYEQQKSKVVVKLFTSISPYETMHDDICMQVVDKRVCMLIVPFHRQWGPNGMTEPAHAIRALNRHLLRTAPCSVGILIERGTLSMNNPLTNDVFYSVGIVFIEGEDDREALAYAMRMAYHPHVRITLIRLLEPQKKNKKLINRDPDGDLIHKFKVDCIQIKRHDYKEEIVRDSVEMINVLRLLEGCFDLILVGRRHDSESILFNGLSDWNEYPELGPIGDMLVASDSTFDGSVLVVQQQKKSGVGYHDLHLDSAFNAKKEAFTIVEVHPDPKVWPSIAT